MSSKANRYKKSSKPQKQSKKASRPPRSKNRRSSNKSEKFEKQSLGSQKMIGTLKKHRDGFGFVIPDSTRHPQLADVFIPARYIGDAWPDDLVEVELEGRDDPRGLSGKITKIIQHGREQWVGTLVRHGKKWAVCPERLDRNLRIPVQHLGGAKEGEMVAINLKGDVLQVLGAPGERSAELESIIAAHGFSREFPKNVSDAADQIPQRIPFSETEKRVDLRGRAICTIDGADAKDFDDAVYGEYVGEKEGFKVWVCIADVAHYITRGSVIDKEALRRGTSVYFPRFAIPMLPETLSNGVCSLKPQEDRLTLTCEMELNAHGELKSASLYESVICSQRRTTYEEIENFLHGDPESLKGAPFTLKESIRCLEHLTKVLLRSRKRRGAIDFQLPESKINYNEDGTIGSITRKDRLFSHMLIEELMVLANHVVSRCLSDYHVPQLFRLHEEPKKEKLKDFYTLLQNLKVRLPKAPPWREPRDYSQFLESIAEHPLAAFLNQTMLRSMPQAVYKPETGGHFGLALRHYCHFTSPIRRYPDLVIHRQLKQLLRLAGTSELKYNFREQPKQSTFNKDFYKIDTLSGIGQSNSMSEREAMEAEREALDLLRAYFMRERVGETFDGTIRRFSKQGMWIELKPHYVEGFLEFSRMEGDHYYIDSSQSFVRGRRTGQTFNLGDKITTQVRDVSIFDRRILLELPNAKPKRKEGVLGKRPFRKRSRRK